MIVVLVVLLVAIAVGRARGGSLARLSHTRFRFTPLLFGALLVQVGAEFLPVHLRDDVAIPVLVATQAAVAVFLVANRSLAGTALAGAGLVLNVVVIAANGAMPVSPSAAEAAGMADWLREPGVKHEVLSDDTLLPWLADVIPLPLLRQVISVGDIVLAAGIARLILKSMGRADDKEVAVGETGSERRASA